jgi:hypothetical protein
VKGVQVLEHFCRRLLIVVTENKRRIDRNDGRRHDWDLPNDELQLLSRYAMVGQSNLGDCADDAGESLDAVCSF